MKIWILLVVVFLAACAGQIVKNTPKCRPGELTMIRDASGKLILAPPDAKPDAIYCGTVVGGEIHI